MGGDVAAGDDLLDVGFALRGCRLLADGGKSAALDKVGDGVADMVDGRDHVAVAHRGRIVVVAARREPHGA